MAKILLDTIKISPLLPLDDPKFRLCKGHFQEGDGTEGVKLPVLYRSTLAPLANVLPTNPRSFPGKIEVLHLPNPNQVRKQILQKSFKL